MGRVDVNLIVRTQNNVEQRDDYNWIKKHFGEKFAKKCRTGEMFARIMEHKGALSHILEEHFQPSKNLHDDLTKYGAWENFKNYIYNFFDVEAEHRQKNDVETKTAKELMEEAGYILYPECQTEADIQFFRHLYYRPDGETPTYNGGVPVRISGEELCTFNGGRLKSCRVWFAVKKNVDEIKRENFKNPTRQDEYGTSVISIQFTKSESSILSIKNRYNHTVNNPDNTFNSDLDNIIPGLSDAFERDYGAKNANEVRTGFELPGYVKVGDKFYKYNYEINNIYYCENNVIIDHFEVKQLPTHLILADYFIFDPKEKTIKLYDKNIIDSFPDSIGEIEQIDFNKKEGIISIKVKNGEDVIITLNSSMGIKALKNNNVQELSGNGFLGYNNVLQQMNLPKLRTMGHSCLYHNKTLQDVNLPMLEECGDSFLHSNKSLQKLNLPKLRKCGNYFISCNEILQEINLPMLEKCGEVFLNTNISLQELNLPMLEKCDDYFLNTNRSLQKLNLPKLIRCGDSFLSHNQALQKINLPMLEECGQFFLYHNETLQELNLPRLRTVGNSFLYYNKSLQKLNLPKLRKCGSEFLSSNEVLQELNLPMLEECEFSFLQHNGTLQELNLPMLRICGDNFLYCNKTLQDVNLPMLESCGFYFLYSNKELQKITLPKLKKCGFFFLYHNEMLQEINLSKLRICGDGFLGCNEVLQQLDLPELKTCGDCFLCCNRKLKKVNLPMLEECGECFLHSNETLQEAKLPNLEKYGDEFLSSHPKKEEFINCLKSTKSV